MDIRKNIFGVSPGMIWHRNQIKMVWIAKMFYYFFFRLIFSLAINKG